MKKTRIVLALLTLCLTLSMLFSCNVGGSGGGGGSVADPNKPNLIFNTATDLTVIYADADIPKTLRDDLSVLINSMIGSKFNYAYEVPEEVAKHEIIIGKSSRAVSVKAYEMLDRLMDEEDESKGGYVIYSDGSSLAAAYTEEYTTHIIEIVFDYLTEICDTEELVIPRGVPMQECIDLYAIYDAEDSEHRAQEWAAFEEEMGSEITQAFKYLYGMYSSDVVEWLANLYEPRVCVCNNFDENGIRKCLYPKDAEGNYICKNGGFYYSNSGRNTYGYGIDIESTIQALGIIQRAGMTREFGFDYQNALPTQIKEDIIAFIKSCQDPNGFFYHPQWTHEAVDAQLGRRGRDLMWAQSMLEKFGVKPFYDTAGGMEGEGAPDQNIVSPTALTVRLGTSKVLLTSKIVSVAEPVAEHLVSAEAFKAYLETLPINTYSYNIGNQLAAQSVQLVNRDKQLNGAISKVLFEWTNSHQNPENGLWESKVNHSSVNGLFKILTFYNDFKQPFPYAYEAARSAIQVIASDEKPAHVCSIYNAWWDVGALLKNMELYNLSYTSAEREEIRQGVLAIAADGLYATRDWYEVFLKNSGSFSYTPDYASATSQGMPVALPKTAEGDVNATEICLNGLRNHAAYALGVSVTPDLFGTLEMVKFLHIIENASPSVKDETPEAEPFDFEYDDLGIKPELLSGNFADSEIGLLMSGGYATISYAPDDRSGKVLRISHLANPGKGDDINLKNIGNTLNTNSTILDTDFYLASEGTTLGASVLQFALGKAYMFYMQTTSDGQIKLWEGSAFGFGKSKDRLLATIDFDTWHNIRIEYYPGTQEDVRIKLYLNDELLIVSDNFLDDSATKFTDSSVQPPQLGDCLRIVGHSSYAANLYLDNILLSCEKRTYKSEADTEGLIVNADKTGGERIVYNFNDGSLPEGVTITDENGTTGKITVDADSLKLNAVGGTSTLTIPVNVREGAGNVYSFGFDMQLTSTAKAGDTITVVFNVPYAQYGITKFMEIAFKVMQVGDTLALVPTNGGGKEIFYSAMIPVSDEGMTSIELAYFKESNTTLIYSGGIYVGSTEFYTPPSTYEPYHYDFSSISFIYKGSVTATLDNIFAEVRRGDYYEETKPTCDRVLYDFETNSTDGFVTDGEISGGVLKLNDGATLTVPATIRANFVSSFTLSAKLNTASLSASKKTNIVLKDADGAAVFALELVKRGDKLEIYEVSTLGTLEKPVATIALEEEINISLVYYTVNDIVTLTVNDKLVLSTTIFAADDLVDAQYASITTYGMTLDDVYFEGMNNVYRAAAVESENLDNTSDVITYEYSSTGNLPSRLTTTLRTGGGKAAIELMERDGKIGKVLNFATSAGDADALDFNLTADGKVGANKLVFETDVMFAHAVEDTAFNFEIYFLDSKSNTAYKSILAQKVDKSVSMYDISNNYSAGVSPIVSKSATVANAFEWMKLRIEIDMGDSTDETLKYRFFVNNSLVYESNNYWKKDLGAPCAASEIAKIRFTNWGATIGSVYFDNTTMYKVDSF